MKKLMLLPLTFGLFLTSVPSDREGLASEMTPRQLDGLLAAVRVVWDSDGVPHVYAQSDHDAFFMMGYLHARDRLFQMDFSRRTYSGTLAELMGGSALPQDIQFRTLGLRRAAEESHRAYTAPTQALFQAYADGVNTYIGDESHPLPPEYADLELTTVSPWTPVDSVTIAKGVAFGLSFEIGDMERTLVLEAYKDAGQGRGFDGRALFFEDLFRSQPLDPSLTIPDSAGNAGGTAGTSTKHSDARLTDLGDRVKPQTSRLIRRYLKTIRDLPWFSRFLDKQNSGSNLWVISGDLTDSGYPMIANDPHLALNTPPIFYEIHLSVLNDPINGAMNINGVGFAGTPVIAQGCNDRICWGSTVNPMDVTDVYEEVLFINPVLQLPTHTFFDLKPEPLVRIPQTYRVNQVGNGESDDLVDAEVGDFQGGLTFLVPRRNMGPLVAVDTSELPFAAVALSIQYTGFRTTREPEAFIRWMRAGSVDDFKEGLQYFDVGSQNWAYADIEGNIAYFTSAEMPLREDLQEGAVDGMPPYLVRDGTHLSRNEWLPLESPQPGQAIDFEILPFEEMPQTINPAQGYVANANNDPLGTTLDNNVFNQTRPDGGIFYLSPGYTSLRMGRIRRLIEAEIAGDGKISLQDMQRIQSNHQLLDAEIFLPYLLAAFNNAGQPGVPEQLMQLASDAGVVEAVGRLSLWDFSTPTGIAGGYDPGDDPSDLPVPTQQEVLNSVAATIYSAWRGQLIRNILDKTLSENGLTGEAFRPDSLRSLSAIQNLLENFSTLQGVGVSGVDFFRVEEIESPPAARDFLLLKSLRDALDLLAGEDFSSAFHGSDNQMDYRWGYLHRITFDHPLNGPFSVPPGGGFDDTEPGLPGVSRSGGFETVDASSHSARAARTRNFEFGSGPARRFVGEMTPEGPLAFQIIAGGQSGLPGSEHHTSQLGRWLTNQYHPLRLTPEQVAADEAQTQTWVPASYRLFFPSFRNGADRFTGFAVSNLSPSDLDLTFTTRDGGGLVQPLPDNPSSGIVLGPSRQSARLGSDIFGLAPSTVHAGWVELSVVAQGPVPTLGPALGSFTQLGDGIRQLDGSTAFTSQSRRLIFTRIAEGATAFRGHPVTTFLNLANPNDEEIEIELNLVSAAGGAPAGGRGVESHGLSTSLTIPALGFVSGSVAELFEANLEVSAGYVDARVTKGRGAVGTEWIQLGDQFTLLALNASFGNGLNESYSAQLAGSPDVFTSINLVNLGPTTRNLTLEALGDDGSLLAAPVPVTLEPGQARQQDADQIFSFPQSPAGGAAGGPAQTVYEGSLRIESDGGGVVGDVIFGDPTHLAFAAALPVQTQTFSKAVFSQVANALGLFTGLALFNPGQEPTQIQIDVFTAEGALSGTASLALQPSARVSDLLTQFVPASSGQIGGYIVVDSTQPLIAQQLFGTFQLSLFSAVPPTVIR